MDINADKTDLLGLNTSNSRYLSPRISNSTSIFLKLTSYTWFGSNNHTLYKNTIQLSCQLFTAYKLTSFNVWFYEIDLLITPLITSSSKLVEPIRLTFHITKSYSRNSPNLISLKDHAVTVHRILIERHRSEVLPVDRETNE